MFEIRFPRALIVAFINEALKLSPSWKTRRPKTTISRSSTSTTSRAAPWAPTNWRAVAGKGVVLDTRGSTGSATGRVAPQGFQRRDEDIIPRYHRHVAQYPRMGRRQRL